MILECMDKFCAWSSEIRSSSNRKQNSGYAHSGTWTPSGDIFISHKVEVNSKTLPHMQVGRVMYNILQIPGSYQLVPDSSLISGGEGKADSYFPQTGAANGYLPQTGSANGYVPQTGAANGYVPQTGAENGCVPHTGSVGADDPAEVVSKALLCFNNNYVYSSCEQSYRLTESGNINVPPDYADQYCHGPCFSETNLVLDCIDNILSHFLFYNRASIEDVRETIKAGCSYGPERGNFNVAEHIQARENSAPKGSKSVMIGLLLMIAYMEYYYLVY